MNYHELLQWINGRVMNTQDAMYYAAWKEAAEQMKSAKAAYDAAVEKYQTLSERVAEMVERTEQER